MAVTIQEPRQVGPNTWRLLWSSDEDDPTYRIYANSRFIRSTKAEHIDFPMSLFAAETGVVEILDDATTPPSVAGEAQTLLAWDEVVGAKVYRVERLVDAAWVVVAEVDAGQDRHHYWTPALSGGIDTHDYRVTTVGLDDNVGSPTVVNILTTRHPDTPIVDYSFSDGAKTVTIAAA